MKINVMVKFSYIHASPPQVKHFRAVQEQASTYLDLVCSVCDLSDETVRSTAAEIQQIKITVSFKFLMSDTSKFLCWHTFSYLSLAQIYSRFLRFSFYFLLFE